MPWEIPKKISLLAVAILFLFTFFTLILDAPRTTDYHLGINDVRLYPLFIFLVRNAEAVGHLKVNHLICVFVIRKTYTRGVEEYRNGHLEHLTEYMKSEKYFFFK